jgi:hypothetical protein
MARYQATPDTVADGERAIVQCGDDGVLLARLVNGGSPTANRQATPEAYASGALAATGTIHGSAGGVLVNIQAFNNNAAVRYLQLYDRTSVPGGGATPILSIVIPPANNGGASWADGLKLFTTTGIQWAASTTGATFTAAGSDLIVLAQFYTSVA